MHRQRGDDKAGEKLHWSFSSHKSPELRQRAGRPHKPYEFGAKVAVATTPNRAEGGQFKVYTVGSL